MADTDNQKLASKAHDLHKDLDKLRDEADDKTLFGLGEILRQAGRALDQVGQYDRKEAPTR